MRRLVFIIVWCCPLTLAADWIHIGTLGPVEDISELLSIAFSANQNATTKPTLSTPPERYPILSTGISPGRVASRAQPFPHLKQPLCVIGPDDVSRRWIRTHRTRLIQSNSVCVLTNIDNSTQHQQLSQLLLGIPHYAAPVSDLLRRLSVAHYPLLISRRGIEQ